MLLYKLSSARSVILLTAKAKTYDSPITALLTTAKGFDTAVSSMTWIVVVSIAGVFMLALIFIGFYTLFLSIFSPGSPRSADLYENVSTMKVCKMN